MEVLTLDVETTIGVDVFKIKQCGTCKYWDNHGFVAVIPDGRKSADCLAPRPFWAIEENETWEDEGQDCLLYKKRKE